MHHASSENQCPVEFVRACGSRSIDTSWLTESLLAVCEVVDRLIDRLTIRIVADAEMSRLHESHAGVPGTTDVLTFDHTAGGEAPIDADIAICADEAARRAGEFNHTIERELLLYAVHGLLHCLGFDDHTEQDHQRMHAEEDRLLAAVGVGPTIAPTPGLTPGLTESAEEDPDSSVHRSPGS